MTDSSLSKVYNLSETGCEQLYHYIRDESTTLEKAIDKYLPPELNQYENIIVVGISKKNTQRDSYMISTQLYRLLQRLDLDYTKIFDGGFGYRYKPFRSEGSAISLEYTTASEVLVAHMCKFINTNQDFQLKVLEYLKQTYSSDLIDEEQIYADGSRINDLRIPSIGSYLYCIDNKQFESIFNFIKNPQTTLSVVKQKILPRYDPITIREVVVQCEDTINCRVESHHVHRDEYAYKSCVNPFVVPSWMFNFGNWSNQLTRFTNVCKIVTDNPLHIMLFKHSRVSIKDSKILDNVPVSSSDIESIPDDVLAQHLSQWVNVHWSINDLLPPIHLISTEKITRILNLVLPGGYDDSKSFIHEPFFLICCKLLNGDLEYHVLDNTTFQLTKFLHHTKYTLISEIIKNLRNTCSESVKCVSGDEMTIQQYILDNKLENVKMISPYCNAPVLAVDLRVKSVEKAIEFIIKHGKMYGNISKLFNKYIGHPLFTKIKYEVEKHFVKDNLVKVEYKIGDFYKQEVILAFEYFTTCDVNPFVSDANIEASNIPEFLRFNSAASVVPLLKNETLTLNLTHEPFIRKFYKRFLFWENAPSTRMNEFMDEFGTGLHSDEIVKLLKNKLGEDWSKKLKRKNGKDETTEDDIAAKKAKLV